MSDDLRAYRDEAMGVFLLFGLLGRQVYQQPVREEVQRLVDDEVFTDSPFAPGDEDVVAGIETLGRWTTSWRTDPEAATMDLRVDWTRLFTGSGLAPISPWESTHFSKEKMLFSDRTLDVRDWYRRFGLEVASPHHEPDDHIGLELLFVAHLARLALAAQERGDAAAERRAMEGQRDFCREHVLAWAPAWADRMVELARTDYYRGIALLVRGGLAELARLFAADKVRGS